VGRSKTPRKKTRTTVTDRARKANAKRGNPTGGRKKKTGGGPAISDVELLFRLRIVERALIDGQRGAQVVEALAREGRDVPYSTVSQYQRRVRDKWAAEDDQLRPIWRERQMRKLHDIAAKLERQQAWGHWVNVQRLIADVEGNNAPTKVEVTQREQFDGWTPKELRAFIASEGETVPERFDARGEQDGARGPEWPGNGEHATVH
jgi:hypothetical protein